MQMDLAVIKNQTRVPFANTKTLSPTLSWAQIASRDALPPSIECNITNSRSSITPSIVNIKHKQVVMRARDNKPVPQKLYGLSPESLTRILNDAVQRAGTPQVNKARFTAARINNRGSIVAHTETAGEAEILRQNRDEWREQVMTGLQVIIPTYPVLVHGIPIKSVDMDNKKETLELLRLENKQTIGNHKITDCRWLKKYKQEQKDGSLIIECETPEGANAIHESSKPER